MKHTPDTHEHVHQKHVHTLSHDERTELQVQHAKEITRFNWSRFLAGVACGLGLAALAFTMFGCNVVPGDDYYGRDRYAPSRATDLYDSPYGEGFDPRENE